jgi:methanogen homoaconitase small subunit
MTRVWRFGADVNTDQIVPGRFAPYMTSEAELSQYAFIEARPEFAKEVRAGPAVGYQLKLTPVDLGRPKTRSRA